MSHFEFVFSLFGLLLGFSMVEVLGGLGKALRRRDRVRVGWLVPLLGVLVMLDLTSFWTTAWSLREAIPVNYLTLVLALTFTGIYYLVASHVVPDELDRWPDFDAYYFTHKRPVLAGVFLLNLAGYAAERLLGAEWEVRYIVMNLLFLLLIAATIFMPGRQTNFALLATMVSLYFIGGIMGALGL